jgi:hypothetical protein
MQASVDSYALSLWPICEFTSADMLPIMGLSPFGTDEFLLAAGGPLLFT